MSKSNRLSKIEYLVTYMIIISLACFIGGFFFGAHVMKNRYLEEKAAVEKAEQEKREREKKLLEQRIYKEQDLVSFYYHIYAPLENFRREHFRFLNNFQTYSEREQEDLVEHILEQATQTISEVKKGTPSHSSPLLIQAKSEYLRSLQAYTEGVDNWWTSSNHSSASLNQHLQQFHNLWLQAQIDFYESIALWEQANVTKQVTRLPTTQALPLTKWKTLTFHQRNYLSALNLARWKRVTEFNPEDMTAKIDSVIQSGQTEAAGWKDINQAGLALLATNAVLPDEYSKRKDTLYPNVKVPEIPLFTE